MVSQSGSEEGSGGQAHHVIEHPHMCLASIEPASWWGVVVVGSDAREIWGLMSPMGQMSPMGLMGQRGPIGQMGLMSPMSPMGLMGQRSPIGRCMRIEASCQTVVTTRLKRAGMCWTPEGLDAILPLRTSMLNRTYDDFWEHRSRLVA